VLVCRRCMSMELGIYAHKEPCTSTHRALTDLFLLPFTGRFYHATTVLELHGIGNSIGSIFEVCRQQKPSYSKPDEL
jgi:hypothetical protein